MAAFAPVDFLVVVLVSAILLMNSEPGRMIAYIGTRPGSSAVIGQAVKIPLADWLARSRNLRRSDARSHETKLPLFNSS